MSEASRIYIERDRDASDIDHWHNHQSYADHRPTCEQTCLAGSLRSSPKPIVDYTQARESAGSVNCSLVFSSSSSHSLLLHRPGIDTDVYGTVAHRSGNNKRGNGCKTPQSDDLAPKPGLFFGNLTPPVFHFFKSPPQRPS